MVDEWSAVGIRPVVYASSYLGDLSEIGVDTSDYFKDAVDNGYFVKNSAGEPYVLNSVSLRFGIIDFTNPEAREFCKRLIRENVIGEARAFAWMHDFGEYMPFDAVLHNGADPLYYHNEYITEWARCGYEVLQELPDNRGDDYFFFMRGATARSPAYTRLFWMGDQLPTYDEYDGMWSAVIGMMNAGLCGYTMGCSDIGGYTCHELLPRTSRLVERWLEMNTFSDMVMRSHPSNRPEEYQLWDSEETMAHAAKFVQIHVALADYKRGLMNEAHLVGSPCTRPMLLHFRDDARARADKSQFMLGPCLLMAPVFSETDDARDVYLPGPASWKHIFSGRVFEVSSEGLELKQFAAPIGKPAVFYRDTD